MTSPATCEDLEEVSKGVKSGGLAGHLTEPFLPIHYSNINCVESLDSESYVDIENVIT